MVSINEELDIADFLLIAEAILEVDAKDLAQMIQIPQAESALTAPFASFGGIVFYENPVERAGIVCSRIVRNHPLPDGNKRVAYECMIEMLFRAGIEWKPAAVAEDDAQMVEGLAAREISEPAFIDWLRVRVGPT